MKLPAIAVIAIAILTPCSLFASARIMDSWKRVQITTEQIEISAAANRVGDKFTELRIRKKGGRWVSVSESTLRLVPWPQLQSIEVQALCRESKCSSYITVLFSADSDEACTYGDDTECSSASFEYDGKRIASFKTFPPLKYVK